MSDDGIEEIVIGETGRDLVYLIVDENGKAVDVTGSTSLRFQATSPDVSKTLNLATGVVTDGPGGEISFPSSGDPAVWVSVADLGLRPSALFNARWRRVDAAGEVTYGPLHPRRWVLPPFPGSP